MPDFSLIKPVGGPARSMADYLGDIYTRHDTGMKRRQQEMELQDAQQKRGERVAEKHS